MELAYGGGLGLAAKLAAAGKQVFVDLKLHDIPNTVERATAQIARLGATSSPSTPIPRRCARRSPGAKGSGLKLLAVSVLTSSDDADLAEAGYAYGVRRAGRAPRRAGAGEAGVDGLVASAAEAAHAARRPIGGSLLLVTPGIRPAGAAVGDQKRVATPAAAIADGADYLVVGRPVTQATDPRAAAERIVAEIAAAALTACHIASGR